MWIPVQLLDSSLIQWNLDSRFQSLVGFPDSLRCILDSKGLDSGFHKQKFPRFQNLDSPTWGEPVREARERHQQHLIPAVDSGEPFLYVLT